MPDDAHSRKTAGQWTKKMVRKAEIDAREPAGEWHDRYQVIG